MRKHPGNRSRYHGIVRQWLKILAIVALWCTAGGAYAQIFRVWDSPVSDFYSNPFAWSPSGVPGPDDGAGFNHDATYTVSFPSSQTTGVVTVSDGSVTFDLDSSGTSRTLTVPGTLTVTGDAALTIREGIVSSGNLMLTEGGHLVLRGTPNVFAFGQMTASDDAEVSSGGLLDVRTGGVAGIAGGLHVGTGSDGSVLADDNFSSSLIPASISVADATSRWGEDGGAADLTFRDGAVGFFADVDMARSTTPGTTAMLTLSNSAEVSINSLRMADLGGTTTSAEIFIGQNSVLTAIGPLATIGHVTDGSATIEITGSGSEADFSGTITTVRPTGSVSMSDFGEFITDQDFTLAGGALHVGDSGLFTANSGANVLNFGGTISGGGVFMFQAMSGVVHNAGIVTPGDENDATLNITGDFQQTAMGTLAIELGGTEPDLQFDRLSVSSDVALAGTLDVALIDTFQPALNDEFTIIDASIGNITGVFDTVNVPSFNGLTFDIIYNPQSVVLEVIEATGLTADFDGDGDVDDVDLGIWESAFGATDLADADGDGDSDGLDFLRWQEQFTGSLPLAAADAVPEPTDLISLSIAVVLLLNVCNRSQR